MVPFGSQSMVCLLKGKKKTISIFVDGRIGVLGKRRFKIEKDKLAMTMLQQHWRLVPHTWMLMKKKKKKTCHWFAKDNTRSWCFLTFWKPLAQWNVIRLNGVWWREKMASKRTRGENWVGMKTCTVMMIIKEENRWSLRVYTGYDGCDEEQNMSNNILIGMFATIFDDDYFK